MNQRYRLDRFYILTNRTKDPEHTFTDEVIRYLESAGKICQEVHPWQEQISDQVGASLEGACLLVLGGDGTVLDAAARLKGLPLPVFAINLGTLGYLAEVDRSGWKEALDLLMQDAYELEDRMMLEGRLPGREGEAYALNDVVFFRSGSLRLISINVYVDGQFLNTVNADGVIVATPTGSTAYNLSAGGPIVEPTGSIIVLTPICAQSMYARSLVFSAKDLITLELAHSPHGGGNEAEASFDGRKKMILREGDRIEIRKSARTVRLVRISRQSFLQTLHKKLSRADGF